MMRRIKVSLSIGVANAKQEDYYDIPDNWDSLSEGDKEEFLEDVAQEFGSNHIDLCAWVEEVNEKS